MFVVKQFSLVAVLLLTLNIFTTFAKSIDTAQASLTANSQNGNSNLIAPGSETKADDDDDGSKSVDPRDIATVFRAPLKNFRVL
ncbi:putative transporter mch1 [Orchesella cincta]|uniref:Putative transporter mch1 n=1 Tax=Orchesella cincta TaxID=48709 RepID=A0A1D2MPW9_ORCCI|nr:putative transporter mch1 [Orchesella cincta]